MKDFLRKRWHGLPLGIITVFALVGVVAAAGFVFLSGTLDMQVEEACTLQTWDGSSWVDQEDGFSITLSSAYPGESVVIPMQIINVSSSDLTVTGVYTLSAYPSGGYGDVTVSGGFSGGIVCTQGTGTRDDLTLTVANDAPPGTYTFTTNFTRS